MRNIMYTKKGIPEVLFDWENPRIRESLLEMGFNPASDLQDYLEELRTKPVELGYKIK